MTTPTPTGAGEANNGSQTSPGYPPANSNGNQLDMRRMYELARAFGMDPVALYPSADPNPDNHKRPVGDGWKKRKFTLDDFEPGYEIGVKLEDLFDVDLDHSVPRALAPLVLPHTSWIFGRESCAFAGHYIYRFSGTFKKSFPLRMPKKLARELGLKPGGDDKASFIEWRSGGGMQTMAPGSTHPSGEPIQFRDGIPSTGPALVDPAELYRAVALLMVLSIIVLAYPAQGVRHELANAMTGMLIRAGLSDEKVDSLVRAVAELANDEEAHKRGGHAATTRAKLDAGEQVTGLPTVCEFVGVDEPTQNKFREWLGLADDPVVVPSNAIIMRPGELSQVVDQEVASIRGSTEPI